MRKNKIVIFGIIALVLLAVAVWWSISGSTHYVLPATGHPSSSAPYTVPALTKSYSNDAYHFSLKLPEDFSVQDMGAAGGEGSDTLVLQDAAGNGIQIVISPYDDVKTLTADDIRAAIPDMQVTDEQPLVVGDYTGVAFKSDNDAFGGASREVWFVFKGNLYQISTYDRLDDLLKQLFGTWKFF